MCLPDFPLNLAQGYLYHIIAQKSKKISKYLCNFPV